ERPAHPDQVRAVAAPDGNGSEDRSAAAQREHRGSRSGTGLLAEEVHEDAPARAHVLVDGDGEHFPPAQDRQRGPGGAALGKMGDAAPQPAGLPRRPAARAISSKFPKCATAKTTPRPWARAAS